MARTHSLIRGAMIWLRIGLGGLFVWAGAAKAWDPSAFLLEVQGYRLLPYQLAVGTALYLPWLELVCGWALILGRTGARGALGVLTLLMGVFVFALATGWYRGLDITCGCFGAGKGQTDYSLWMARNLGLMGAMIILWAYHPADVKRSQSRGE